MTIALVSSLLAVWGSGHKGQFVATAIIFFVVGIGFLGAAEEDKGNGPKG